MKLISVLCCALTVLVVKASCGKLNNGGSSPLSLTTTLEEVYKMRTFDWLREKEFVSRMWPAISKSIPQSVKLPSIGMESGTREYPCTDETEIHIKVGGMVQSYMNLKTDFVQESKNYIAAAFVGTFTFTQDVSFEIYKMDTAPKGRASNKKTTVKFSFGPYNRIEFLLSIPNFSKKSKSQIPIKCAIYIESVSIEKLSEPTLNPANKIGNQFWNSVKEADIYEMMRFGIMKAMLDELDKTHAERGWVCASEYFKQSLNRDGSGDADDESEDSVKITNNGKMTFKKVDPTKFLPSIQYGVETFVDEVASNEDNTVTLTKSNVGSGQTDEFTFDTYAPNVFRSLRILFGVENTYKDSFCKGDLKVLVNPGKSGSGLYLSQDALYIAKTVQKGEAKFLLGNFLSEYENHMKENKFTLLPKFFGLYWYSKSNLNPNVRLIVMNNLMPAGVRIHQKYDLKGSRYKREAFDRLQNESPTFKDINFLQHHPDGIYLKKDDYEKLIDSIKKDCEVLKKSHVIDYSMLLGLQYVKDLNIKDRDLPCVVKDFTVPCEPIESTDSKQNNAQTGIPARTAMGAPLLLHVGIIDMLQDYGLLKKAENKWKYIYLRGEEYSVVDPESYANRFMKFMKENVFKMMPRCKGAVDKDNPRNKLPTQGKLGDLFI